MASGPGYSIFEKQTFNLFFHYSNKHLFLIKQKKHSSADFPWVFLVRETYLLTTNHLALKIREGKHGKIKSVTLARDANETKKLATIL